MSWNLKQNPDGSAEVEAGGGASEDTNFGFTFEDGKRAEVGRGVTDPDITYIQLHNASGTPIYVYPDAAGTAIVVTPTKP